MSIEVLISTGPVSKIFEYVIAKRRALCLERQIKVLNGSSRNYAKLIVGNMGEHFFEVLPAGQMESIRSGGHPVRLDSSCKFLQEPNLQEPNLQEPNLQDAILQEPNLQEPNLQDATLQEPNLQEQEMSQPRGRIFEPLQHQLLDGLIRPAI